ncbi:unnamed protein product [Camellia sinensis]
MVNLQGRGDRCRSEWIAPLLIITTRNKDSFQNENFMLGCRFLEAELQDMDRVLSGREIWKRHKKKVYFTIGVLGSGYLLYKLYDAHKRRLSDLERELAQERENDELIKAHMQAHFGNIQRITDTATLPHSMLYLSSRVAEELDLLHLTEQLIRGKGFTRMVLSLWAMTMLSLYIRVQVNILDRHLYIDTARDLGSSHLLASATTDASYEFVVTTTQHSIRDANNPARGDLDRVPFKGYGNYCRLGPDAWDEDAKASVKLVLLDEADAMTKDAQFALRRVIEKYTKSTRFALICNHVNKIIPALQSRCTRFQFAPLDAINVMGREELQDILLGIINQLGPDNLDNLRKLAEQFQKQAPGAGAGADATAVQEDDDDQVLDLVAGETFEAAAEERNLILLRPCGS